jgi:hypothetical protein
MDLKIYLDIKQLNLKTLVFKDISNEDDYVVGFPSTGKTAVYAHYLAIKHSSESRYRYFIGYSNTVSPSLPYNETPFENISFKEMSEETVHSEGFTKSQPTNNILQNVFVDGVYSLMYGVGKAPANYNLVANTTYYLLTNATVVFNGITTIIPSGSIIKPTTSGTINNTAIFVEISNSNTESVETSSVFMLSANLLSDYADALIKLDSVKNSGINQQISGLVNDFRTYYDRTKVLVLVDSYDAAVASFEDCETLLNQINNIL